jgi:hypothetical protein
MADHLKTGGRPYFFCPFWRLHRKIIFRQVLLSPAFEKILMRSSVGPEEILPV